MKDRHKAIALFWTAGGVFFMRNTVGYRTLTTGLTLVLGMAMAASLAEAQQAPRVPSESDLFCTGVATDQPIPAETYLISGENSRYQIVFKQGDFVYINRGAEQGVKVGDVFQVM